MAGERILIVDDEASSLELLEGYLKEKGFEVACAVNGKECMLRVSDFVPDIIILDVRLPDQDGLDILKNLQRREHPPYVIMVTAFHDMATTIKAMRRGAFEYIPKPIDVDELEGAVLRAVKVSKARGSPPGPPSRTPGDFSRDELIGKTREMNEIFKAIGILSENRVTVLIEGETGTGKELVARAIHFHGSHRDEPFVAINCSAIVENLLESELFGHEKGAFTGAVATRKGLFETAKHGTIFLDEVAEIPFELQAKLLRVLQEKEFHRVGGERSLRLNARVIAATNRDLPAMVRAGQFREDVYYRLSVASIRIPPLRDRKLDISLIVQHLLAKINADLHGRLEGVDAAAMKRIMDYPWPGNVRELENILTKAALITKGNIILDDTVASLLHSETGVSRNEGSELSRVSQAPESEKEGILRVLNEVHWHYGHACEALGISRPTLRKRMKVYGIPSKSGWRSS